MSHLPNNCQPAAEFVQQCIQQAAAPVVHVVQPAAQAVQAAQASVDVTGSLLNVFGFAVGLGSLIFSLMVYQWTRDADKRRAGEDKERDKNAADRHTQHQETIQNLHDLIRSLKEDLAKASERAEISEDAKEDIKKGFAEYVNHQGAAPPASQHAELMAKMSEQQRDEVTKFLESEETLINVWDRRLNNPKARNAGWGALTTKGRILKIWTGGRNGETYVSDQTS
jgi:hypothetical protein